MQHRNHALRGAFAGLLFAVGIAATAVAYSGQVAATIEASGPTGPQACGTPLTISATIVDINDDLISGQPVAWTFGSGKVSGDKIDDGSTVTNANGVAKTTIQLGCVAHSVKIIVTADDVQGSGVVRSSGEGLPRTDTALTSGGETTSPLAMLLAAVAVLLGSGIILRRFAADRR
jgi:hypothetical protein